MVHIFFPGETKNERGVSVGLGEIEHTELTMLLKLTDSDTDRPTVFHPSKNNNKKNVI